MSADSPAPCTSSSTLGWIKNLLPKPNPIKKAKEKMKICMVWDADYPWDVRIEKVACSLVQSGHEVHLVCRNVQCREAYEYNSGIHIHRLPKVFKILARINNVLTFPAFFNPIWLYKILKVSKKQNVSLIIVRDLPLGPSGLLIASFLGIPCMLDMAECYPEMLRCTWKFEGVKLKNILARNPLFADLVEKYCLKRMDMTLVMIDESYKRLQELGVPDSRIAIVSNTPKLSASEKYDKARNNNSNNTKLLEVIYIGLINPSRGLDTVIEGAYLLKKDGFDFTINIAGSGKDEARIRNLIAEKDLANRIKLLGWIDHTELDKLFSRASIGLVPHHACSHWNHTIPNKLFDYMAAGIPVLSTNVRPMARIIRTEECGLIYQDWDPESFANSIITLNDVTLRERLGKNGRKAVLERYNWEREELALNNALSYVTQ